MYFQTLTEMFNSDPYEVEKDPKSNSADVVYYFKEKDGGALYKVHFEKQINLGKFIYRVMIGQKATSLKTFKKVISGRFDNPIRVIATIIKIYNAFAEEGLSHKGFAIGIPADHFGNYIKLFQSVISRKLKGYVLEAEYTAQPPSAKDDGLQYFYLTRKPNGFSQAFDGKWIDKAPVKPKAVGVVPTPSEVDVEKAAPAAQNKSSVAWWDPVSYEILTAIKVGEDSYQLWGYPIAYGSLQARVQAACNSTESQLKNLNYKSDYNKYTKAEVVRIALRGGHTCYDPKGEFWEYRKGADTKPVTPAIASAVKSNPIPPKQVDVKALIAKIREKMEELNDSDDFPMYQVGTAWNGYPGELEVNWDWTFRRNTSANEFRALKGKNDRWDARLRKFIEDSCLSLGIGFRVTNTDLYNIDKAEDADARRRENEGNAYSEYEQTFGSSIRFVVR